MSSTGFFSAFREGTVPQLLIRRRPVRRRTPFPLGSLRPPFRFAFYLPLDPRITTVLFRPLFFRPTLVRQTPHDSILPTAPDGIPPAGHHPQAGRTSPPPPTSFIFLPRSTPSTFLFSRVIPSTPVWALLLIDTFPEALARRYGSFPSFRFRGEARPRWLPVFPSHIA